MGVEKVMKALFTKKKENGTKLSDWAKKQT